MDDLAFGNHGEGLLRRPIALAGESLPGYLVRLASANFLAGINGLAAIHRVSTAKLLKLDRHELVESFWGSVGLQRADAQIILSRSQTIFCGSLAPCRVCVQCLREESTPIFKEEWDLPMSLYCTKHKVMLRDSCDSCGKRLDYLKARSVLKCNCGADLSTQPISPVTEEFHSMRRVFASGHTGDIYNDVRTGMAAAVVIRMAHQADSGLYFGRMKRARQSFVTQREYELAKVWFSKWPRGFNESCKKANWTRTNVLKFGRQAYFYTRQFPALDAAFEALLLRPSDCMQGTPLASNQLLKFPRIFAPMPIPYRF